MALSILDGNQSATTLSTILSSGQHITAHTVVSLGTQAITDMRSAVSGSVVSISNFPASQVISGTVTANLSFDTVFNDGGDRLNVGLGSVAGTDPANWLKVDGGNVPISGTVTANGGDFTGSNGDSDPLRAVQIGFKDSFATGDFVFVNNEDRPFPVKVWSGTVTANLLKPTWTNYSGTVVTANTAFTAITNTSRSYLLAQVTTGQMFLNIGATATTLDSVYFSAGQGFAWETTVPQGIVSIISAVTGTNYVLKEG